MRRSQNERSLCVIYGKSQASLAACLHVRMNEVTGDGDRRLTEEARRKSTIHNRKATAS